MGNLTSSLAQMSGPKKKEKDVNRQNADLHVTTTSLTALEKTQ
jgi:hypothetical protein